MEPDYQKHHLDLRKDLLLSERGWKFLGSYVAGYLRGEGLASPWAAELHAEPGHVMRETGCLSGTCRRCDSLVTVTVIGRRKPIDIGG